MHGSGVAHALRSHRGSAALRGTAGDQGDAAGAQPAGAVWGAHRGGLPERPMEPVLKPVGAVATPSPGVRIPRPPHQHQQCPDQQEQSLRAVATRARDSPPATAPARRMGHARARWGTRGARRAGASLRPTPGQGAVNAVAWEIIKVMAVLLLLAVVIFILATTLRSTLRRRRGLTSDRRLLATTSGLAVEGCPRSEVVLDGPPESDPA